MPNLRKFCFPCLNKKEEVNKLDFSNVAIGEEFPLVWQHERTLEDLSLCGTRISSLPPQLFYCQALRVLNLSNNNLENIPSAVGTLRNLQHLNLSKNFLSSLPDNLKNCRNLTHLDLSCNHFERLPEPITCLLRLEELFLNETYLEFLPANFGRLVNLRILELRVNSLITLPKSMGRLTRLHRVDIGGNEFSELPEVIGDLCKLRELWIDFNQIRRISPNIAKLQDLQHFEANGNLIEMLPNEFGNWRHVEVLSISTNLLKTLPDSIGMLKMLVTLKCEFCELEDIPNSISQLEQLEELVLSHNRLQKLPASIGMLRKLRFLFVDENKLKFLPEELCSCVSLSVLSVSRNQLADLPIDIGRLINLKVLNLVDNSIATLPVSVLNLVNLTSMWISDNQTQPLVPMQYADGAAKTRLTCFMLPQNGISDLSSVKGRHNEGYNQSAQLAAQMNESCQIAFLPRPSQANMLPTPTKKAFARSIGFVEDTIQSCNSENSDYPKGAASPQSSVDDQVLEFGPRLMRSPTPYPKELRLMAKYMRTGQKIQEIAPHVTEVREARVVTKNIETEQMPPAPIPSEYSVEGGNQTGPQYYHTDETGSTGGLHQAFYNLVPNMSGNQTEIITCQNENGDYFLVQTNPEYALGNTAPQVAYLTATGSNPPMPASNLYTYYSTAPQLSIPEIYNSNSEVINQTVLPEQYQQQFISPPPYHIARNFTKKTPEDLSNYETMRKNQSMQLQSENSNFPLANTNFNSQNCNQPAYDENSVPMIEIKKDDFDNQNNLVNSKEETTCYISVDKSSNKTVASISAQQKEQFEQAVDCIDGAARTNDKRKTPWLFGKHKNPTVKQVTLKCEQSEPGFTIGNIDNEEGIFVLSVNSESNASRFLLVHDKLLEINGHDFTNLSLELAQQLLSTASGLISIMLSRK